MYNNFRIELYMSHDRSRNKLGPYLRRRFKLKPNRPGDFVINLIPPTRLSSPDIIVILDQIIFVQYLQSIPAFLPLPLSLCHRAPGCKRRHRGKWHVRTVWRSHTRDRSRTVLHRPFQDSGLGSRGTLRRVRLTER